MQVLKKKSIQCFIEKFLRGDIIKSLFKAVVVLTGFSVLTRILGFLFKIFLSRTLTTEMLGIYSIVISVFMVFVTMLNSGMQLAVSKNTTLYHNKDNKKCHGGITSGLIISLSICLIIFIIILLFKPFFINYFGNEIGYNLLLTMLPAIIFTGVYAPFKGYLWGRESFFKVSIVEFIEQVLRIGSFFVLIAINAGLNQLYPAGISVSIGCIISTIVGIILFFVSGGRLKSPKYAFKPIFKSAMPITLVRIATSLMQPFLALILPIQLMCAGYTNSQALSQIGIAMGMTMPLLSIPSTIIGSLAMAIIPKLTSLNDEINKQKLIKQISSAINFTFICGFIVLPCFIALGEPICLFLFDNITAGTYLKYACWLIIPMGISQITTSILNSLNLEVKTFIYYIISSVVLVGCVFILPKYVGIYALMFGMGFSTLVVSILNIIKINKTIGSNKTYLAIILKLCVILLPCTYLTKWLYNVSAILFPKIIAIILAGGVSVIAFTLLMSVFGVVDVTIIKSLKPQKVKKMKVKIKQKV